MTKKTPRETRIKLLEATIAVILSDGAAHLTLDAVVRQAGVSKGGLLHHFPTKESLLHGLVELAEQTSEHRLAHELEQEPEGKAGRWCRAYIRATLDLSVEETQLTQALNMATSAFPEFFANIAIKPWPRANHDGLPPGRALMIQFACDGIWISDVLRISPLNTTELSDVRAELWRLTQ